MKMFSPAVITAISTLIGCLVSGVVSLKVASKQHDRTEALVIYRLGELEKKVEKHNNLVERTYKLESDSGELSVRLENLQEDIRELKR